MYDKIELPPVKAVVTRVTRSEGMCEACGEATVAPVPNGMEAGSPYGEGIEALATYYRYNHAVSYERLTQMFSEVYGVQISEGALSNLLKRVKGKLEDEVGGILERLRSSRIVCSDETGVRVGGRTQWEWGFQNEEVSIHVIRPSRGAKVIAEVFEAVGPSR